MSKHKIKSVEEITELAERLREEGKIIVTVNGAFDILHSAHINLLEEAKQRGDVLIVLINSDASIRKNKGNKRPIIPQSQRARMLVSLECVDYVVVFEEDKPINLFEKIKPNRHVRGGSFDEERLKEEKDLFAKWGGEYIQFSLEKGFSTTNIIQKILDSYTNDTESIAEQWITAFNDHDIEKLLALYHPEARHYSPRIKGDGWIKGKEQMRTWWQGSFDKIPKLRYKLKDLTLDQWKVFMEYTRIAPGDQDEHVMEYFEIKDGVIIESRVLRGWGIL